MKRRALLRYLTECNCHVIAGSGPHTAVMNFSNGRKSDQFFGACRKGWIPGT